MTIASPQLVGRLVSYTCKTRQTVSLLEWSEDI